METYKSIKYKYNTRTKRYLFVTDKTQAIKKACYKLMGKSGTNLLFVKDTNTSFEFHDFFLLELYYILTILKNEEILLAVDIGGIVLSDMIELLENETWLAGRFINTDKLFNLNNITNTMKFKPLPHQIPIFKKYEEIKHLGGLRGGMLDAAPGTGKTYVSLALGELLGYDTVIILAPKNTLYDVWVDSVGESLFKRKQSYVVLTSSSKDVFSNEKYIITNYEHLSKILKDKKLSRKLKKLKPMLIVDENHNLNEITSNRTNYLLEFVNYIDFKDILLLTGTPIKMSVKELKPMLSILDDKFIKIKDKFDSFYSNIGNYTKVDLIRYRFNLYKERVNASLDKLGKITVEEYKVAIKNGDEFTLENIDKRMEAYKHKRLLELYDIMDEAKLEFDVYLERVKEDILKDTLKYPDGIKILNRYKTLVKTIRKSADKGKLFEIYDLVNEASNIEKRYILPNLKGLDKTRFKELKSIVKYPKLKVLGEALGKILLGSRIRCYKELAESIDYKNLFKLTNKKAIVFSNYIDVCKTVIESVKEIGYNPIGIFGDNIDELEHSVKIFNDLKSDINPIVGTYKAMSTGIRLTSANVIILVDTPLRDYILQQALARAHRIGNTEDVLVFLIKLDTGDEFNITDRDLFIVNTSAFNVEMITGNKAVYDIPKQRLASCVDDEDEEDDVKEDINDEIVNEVEDVIEEELTTFVNNNFIGYNFIRSFLRKIKII